MHEDTEERGLSDKTIYELIKTVTVLSANRTGALIVIEDKVALGEYIDTGIPIDAVVTNQLLLNIFEHNTPLHDGAVILRNNRVIAATCYLPLSANLSINKELGTRHRAGVGISEVSDSVTLIVSEETGSISIAKGGELYRNLDTESVRKHLELLSQDDVKKKDERRLKDSKRRRKSTKKSTGKKTDSNNIKTEGLLTTERRLTVMKDKLFSNWGLKLLSLILGFIVWVTVLNVDDYSTTRQIKDIPVTLINTDAITDKNQLYDIVSGETVDIIIKGRRSVVNSLGASDFTAVADMSNYRSQMLSTLQ